jgi:tetratricopeptide (TPR) repeat protein
MKHSVAIHKDILKKLSTLVITMALCLGFSTITTAQSSEMPDDKQQFLTIKNNLQTAVDSLNKAGVIKAKYALVSYAEGSDKELKKLAYYYMGYAAYRLNTLFQDIKEKQKEQFLDKSAQHLEKATNLDDDFADAWALLGSTYGMKAAGFFSGMKYGPKSDKAMSKAKDAEPQNPRVHMLNSIGKLYKPSMFGGSTEGAIEGFGKAASLYEKYRPKNKLMPDWGHAEVYAWLGQGYEQNEQPNEARQAYKQALEINPDYGWVKDKLLPELEEKIN